jgi:glutamate decarboxylase
VAFSLANPNPDHDEHEIADGLRRYGWTVPAYTMAPDAQNVTLLRVVVREDMSHGLVDRLVTDLKRVLATLDGKPSKLVQRVADELKGEEGKVDEGRLKQEVRGKQREDVREKKQQQQRESVSVLDDERNRKGHFGVHKTHGLRKSNGVC